MPAIEDTPLFSSLMGKSPNAPQSALVQAAMTPEVPHVPVLESKPVPAAAPAPVKAEAPAGDKRKTELKAIHGELLELRELIKNLPPLTTPA